MKNIFKKSVQKLYETIADSEGELKNLNIMMMKDMKIKYNLFFENQEMGKNEAEAENVNADINFCDEQLVKDWNREQIDWNAIDSSVESRVIVMTQVKLNGRTLPYHLYYCINPQLR